MLGEKKGPCGHVLGSTWLSYVLKKYRSVVLEKQRAPAGTYSVAHGFLMCSKNIEALFGGKTAPAGTYSVAHGFPMCSKI